MAKHCMMWSWVKTQNCCLTFKRLKRTLQCANTLNQELNNCTAYFIFMIYFQIAYRVFIKLRLKTGNIKKKLKTTTAIQEIKLNKILSLNNVKEPEHAHCHGI